MIRLPRLTGKEIIIALCNAGFDVIRVKGSHHFLRIRMAASRWSPFTQVKSSAPAFWRKFSSIVT